MRTEMKERLADAEKILIGIGGEWKRGSEDRENEIKSAAENLKRLLTGKDYYVISTLSKEDLGRLGFEKSHTVSPLDVSLTEEEWNRYTEWLSRTLNRKLMILELGEGFKHPSVIRWPFERTVMINHKAYMYRIHKTFYQITDEICEKAAAVKADSVEFFVPTDEGGEDGSDR